MLERWNGYPALVSSRFNISTLQRSNVHGWLRHASVEDGGNLRHEPAQLQPGLADVSPRIDHDPHIIVLAGHGQQHDVPFRDQHDVVDRTPVQFLTHVVEHFAGDGTFLSDLLDGKVGIDSQRLDGRTVHPDDNSAHQAFDPAHQRSQQVLYVPSHTMLLSPSSHAFMRDGRLAEPFNLHRTLSPLLADSASSSRRTPWRRNPSSSIRRLIRRISSRSRWLNRRCPPRVRAGRSSPYWLSHARIRRASTPVSLATVRMGSIGRSSATT